MKTVEFDPFTSLSTNNSKDTDIEIKEEETSEEDEWYQYGI